MKFLTIIIASIFIFSACGDDKGLSYNSDQLAGNWKQSDRTLVSSSCGEYDREKYEHLNEYEYFVLQKEGDENITLFNCTAFDCSSGYNYGEYPAASGSFYGWAEIKIKNSSMNCYVVKRIDPLKITFSRETLAEASFKENYSFEGVQCEQLLELSSDMKNLDGCEMERSFTLTKVE